MILADARQLARNEMDKNGLKDWHFTFDKSVSRFGVCRYTDKTIGLSLHLTSLNNTDRVKDTILHEIAHALVGHGQGHNNVWRTQAIQLGNSGTRCYSNTDTITPPKRFKGICPNCKIETLKNARTKTACGKCCKLNNNGKFTSDYLFKWERN